MRVHCLATCLKPEMIRAAVLVFRTIRVGFPKADIFVHGNGLSSIDADLVARVAAKEGCPFRNLPMRSHGAWIEELLETENSGFWIVDTDVVFFQAIEDWFNDESEALFAGRKEPAFIDPWTNSIHVERIHPSLMWFNPRLLRAEIRRWPGVHDFLNTAERNLIRWNFVPVRGERKRFYDTCAGLYHAIEGQVFTEEQNAAYGHLLAATYSHLMKGALDVTPVHEVVLGGNLAAARQLLAGQKEWYRQNAVPTG